jgi:23S rRNA (cytidine1920-2'-O)/16S rRNA (cytidine1409-2'-O)-methyltransferase
MAARAPLLQQRCLAGCTLRHPELATAGTGLRIACRRSQSGEERRHCGGPPPIEDLPMPKATVRQRLDVALVQRGLVVSRARAQDIIDRGEVAVDGIVARHGSLRVGPASRIDLQPGAGAYVSRGALKLEPALDRFGLSPAGRIALDVGAAAGGFTEVLLARGARRVYAIDNGRGQLHPTLRGDPRVVPLEETDARRLDRTLVPEPVGALVADVSFIALHKALPAALRLVEPGAWLVALVKPQFEAGPARVPKDGIVTDAGVHAAVVEAVSTWLEGEPGWRILGAMPSPIRGGNGNMEFLIGAAYAG